MNTNNRQDYVSERLGERYVHMTHPSGLRILVSPKRLTTFSAMLGVEYGSVDTRFFEAGRETPTVTPAGVAHFLEHKLFTNEDGSDSFAHFAALGVDANAYTSFHKTVYLISGTDRFYPALTELVRFVTHPYFTDESVAAERGIIAEEIRMYRDNPYTACFFGMLRGMYRHHGIREDVCGTLASIKRIDPSVLYTCYNAFYHPENMVLSVCGNVDPQAVWEAVDAVLPRGGKPYGATHGTAPETGAVYRPYVHTRKEVKKPIFHIGVKDAVCPADPRDVMRREVAMNLLGEVLFSRSGALYHELLEGGLISPDFSCGYSRGGDVAFFSVAGESDDPERVYRRIREAIDTVATHGIDPADFEAARRVVGADFIKDFDSTEEIAGNLLHFGFERFDIFQYLGIIESITADELLTLLTETFREDAFVLSVVS